MKDETKEILKSFATIILVIIFFIVTVIGGVNFIESNTKQAKQEFEKTNYPYKGQFTTKYSNDGGLYIINDNVNNVEYIYINGAIIKREVTNK